MDMQKGCFICGERVCVCVWVGWWRGGGVMSRTAGSIYVAVWHQQALGSVSAAGGWLMANQSQQHSTESSAYSRCAPSAGQPLGRALFLMLISFFLPASEVCKGVFRQALCFPLNVNPES